MVRALIMISKATTSFVQSLKQKKFRQKYNKFILEGEKIILEGIEQRTIDFDTIFCLDDKIPLFEGFGVEITRITSKELQKLSSLKTPPGILAVANKPKVKAIEDLQIGQISLYLDDIKDPGNLGTIIRTAEWFGVQNVFASFESVELFNPKVLQSTMGSFARIHFLNVEISALKSSFPNIEVVGTSLHGTNMHDLTPTFPVLIVIGNESRGISQTTKSISDRLIKIPKSPGAKTESLNAAVATSIFLSHFTQRL